MGSRRRRYAALVSALLLGACATGAPPGFSEGNQWVVPLIGPLEDGLLLVPALVNGKGPYVFAIDPDAHVSIVDRQVVDEAKPLTGEGPRLLDETDTQQNKFYAEILSWQLGTLTVKGPMPASVVGKGTFDIDGRRIHGVIGRDIIADSLAFGFDRDVGVITLTTQKGFKAPAGAPSFSYSKLQSHIPNVDTLPLPRRLVEVTIGGMRYPLHFDLGATTSQLRERAWTRAQLVGSETLVALVDEAGMFHTVKKKAVASSVAIGTVTSQNVAFVPFVDKRWPDQDIEGSVGLDFFKPYSVTVNWDNDKVYLQPRTRTRTSTQVAARLGRWQSKTLIGCPNVGCVKATLIDPLANKPVDEMPAQHPGLVASFVRDPASSRLDSEVLIAVTPAAGKPPLKWLVANLPAGVERVMTHVSADYIGATLTVIDASPFPRTCPADGGCVDTLNPPTMIDPDAPQLVSELKRIAGPDPIVDGKGEEFGVVGATELSLRTKICTDKAGRVGSIEIVQSSGNPKYDRHVVETVKHWVYEPYVFSGKPVSACTNASFLAHFLNFPGVRDGVGP